jgi:hypothetical protein
MGYSTITNCGTWPTDIIAYLATTGYRPIPIANPRSSIESAARNSSHQKHSSNLSGDSNSGFAL